MPEIKLPVSFPDFIKNPVHAIAYLCLIAVCYLYIDGKISAKETKKMYQDQVTKCETDNYTNKVEMKQLREQVLELFGSTKELKAKLDALNQKS